MVYSENNSITEIIAHKVGNSNSDIDFKISKSKLKLDADLSALLVRYFIAPFKGDEYYNLFHSSAIGLNEVYTYVSKIFDNKDSFYEQSVNLAKHLYEQSTHPKVKPGEFYVVYFKDCIIDGNTTDAVGLFKSENKDTFLKVYSQSDGFEIESQQGVNTNKLDKGCLIFNLEKEKGYIVSIVDNTNKGVEAHYWKDDFLHIKPRKDEYHNTQNVMSLCKEFVTQALPQSVSKAEQVDILNKSVKYFKENESFDMSAFSNDVITNPDLIEIFNRYKSEFELARELAILENFSISESAVKKQARSIKSVIKLDKNFHIYVHGSKELIQQGIEEDGRKYYKIYYKEEL
jgi:hypothetical protein